MTPRARPGPAPGLARSLHGLARPRPAHGAAIAGVLVLMFGATGDWLGRAVPAFDRGSAARLDAHGFACVVRSWVADGKVEDWRPHRDSNPGFSLERATS